ncbi:MAG: hypothetical protein OER12_08650 [Acidimicrobiia bacterium]|nr:hypothetical protein [Acidimicrobiia bacterium]
MKLRSAVLVMGIGLLAAACSSGPSLTDYAADLEQLVSTMNGRLDTIDVIFDEEAPSLDSIRGYADDRMAARNQFLTGFEALDPPSEARDIHEAGLDVLRALVQAEQEVADLAFASDDIATVSALWESPTGQAARAADQRAIELCQAAEQALNSTEERQQLAGVPWVPTELQQIVTVAFGCLAEDR